MVDPDVLDKIKRACSPQKAIYDIANYVETDVISPINEATNTANAAAAQANAAYNRATDALNTANGVAADVARSLVDLNAAGDGSTITLNAPRNTGNPATAPLPVASEFQAGVMNTATYLNIKDLNSRVTSLESNTTTYIVVLPNDTPTQTEILNAYRTAYPLAPNPPLDGTTVIDIEKQLFYRYVKNGTVWIKTSGFNVTPFTNENAGIIKGSTTPGQVQAETDGTGSLVGYDTLVSNIAQNTTAIGTANTRIDAVETKNTEQDTAIARVKLDADASYSGFGLTYATNHIELRLNRNTGDIDTFEILPVDTRSAGIITPAMFNQWNAGKTDFKFANFPLDSAPTEIVYFYFKNYLTNEWVEFGTFDASNRTLRFNKLNYNAPAGMVLYAYGTGNSRLLFRELGTAVFSHSNQNGMALVQFMGQQLPSPTLYGKTIILTHYTSSTGNTVLSIQYPNDENIEITKTQKN